jgi:hypothetical protein
VERGARPQGLLRAMTRLPLMGVAATALFLGLLGLGTAGLGALVSSQRPGEERCGSVTPRAPAGIVLALPASLGAASPDNPAVREAIRPAVRWRETEEVLSSVPDLSMARSEREYLAAFEALERCRPGMLAAQAQERLVGCGTRAEKVGLLRALRAVDAPGSVRWLEFAVRTGVDDSGPHAESLAAFATDVLAELAVRMDGARQALGRLALENPDASPALRRRAAGAFARTAGEAELTGLRPTLARSKDELLVAGILAVLETRPESPAAARILAEFGRP